MKEKNYAIYRILNILITVFCLLGWVNIMIVHNNGSKIYKYNIKAIECVTEIESQIKTMDQNALMAFIGKDSKERVEVYLGNINNAIDKVESTIEEYESISGYLTPAEIERFNSCKLNITSHNEMMVALVDEFDAGNYLEAQTIYLQEFKAIKDSTYELLNATVDLAESSAADSVAKNNEIYEMLCVVFLISAIVGNAVIIFIEYRNNKKDKEMEETNKKLEDTSKKLKQSNKNIENIAYTDILTGLPNRYSLEEFLEEHIKIEDAPSLDIVMLDIDDFKDVNDTYGYNVGDKYLESFVAKISTQHKDRFKMYRVTGNQFCLIFSEGTPAGTVMSVVQDIMSMIQTTVYIDQFAIKRTLTASMLHWNNSNSRNLTFIISTLDRALHQAKAEGKNRIIDASPSISSNMSYNR